MKKRLATLEARFALHPYVAGPEFSAPDGFRGFTSGTADSAAITQLGAGDICAFR